MKPGDLVVNGRCSGCGRVKPIWTTDAIVAAMQAWKELHGHPPTALEWLRSSPENPNASTVQMIFGTWGRGLAAAGLKSQWKPYIHWTKQRVADALVEWRVTHGSWPKPRDWKWAAHDHPNHNTVYKRFRNWDAALDFAGRVREEAAA